LNLGRETLAADAARPDVKPPIRKVFKKRFESRGRVDQSLKGMDDEQAAQKKIGEDQGRMCKNIERTPKESEAFKRYLKTFDDQETEIEKRQAHIKEPTADLTRHEQALREFADGANAE
jgi:adenylate kinase family enzyme